MRRTPRSLSPTVGGEGVKENAGKKIGESIRVFPLSNWTELDIWNYIKIEKIPIVSLYYSKKRLFVIRKKKIIMIDDKRFKLNEGEKLQNDFIRFRTLGCYPLTAGVYSKANNIQKIIYELLSSENSEREGRLIDNDQEASMEKKKLQGYF